MLVVEVSLPVPDARGAPHLPLVTATVVDLASGHVRNTLTCNVFKNEKNEVEVTAQHWATRAPGTVSAGVSKLTLVRACFFSRFPRADGAARVRTRAAHCAPRFCAATRCQKSAHVGTRACACVRMRARLLFFCATSFFCKTARRWYARVRWCVRLHFRDDDATISRT